MLNPVLKQTFLSLDGRKLNQNKIEMNNINLNALCDRAYKIACEHGFHDNELSNEHCLCLVISDLMEAVEADRKNRHFDLSI